MLSMFKDKKGFGVLFENRESNGSEALSNRPSSRQTGERSSRTMHRCERCGKHFSEFGETAHSDFVCSRCDFTICVHCREPSRHPGFGAGWLCCECNLPLTFMRLFDSTRQGTDIVAKIIEFCDPRAERIMRSFFRKASMQVAPRSDSRSARTSQKVSASQKIKQEKEARRSGLSQRLSTGSNTPLHPKSPNQPSMPAKRSFSGSCHEADRSARTRKSSTVKVRSSRGEMAAYPLADKENENSYDLMDIRVSKSSSVGGSQQRKSNVTPFAREPAKTSISTSAEPVRTREEASAAAAAAPLIPESKARSGSADSARSESPAPRFPSFTQFLGDQVFAAAQPLAVHLGSDGALISVSPESEETVHLDAKRVSTNTAATRHSGTPCQQGKPTTETATSKKRSASGFTSRSVHRVLFRGDLSSSRATTLSNPPTPMGAPARNSGQETPQEATPAPVATKKRKVAVGHRAPLQTRMAGGGLKPPSARVAAEEPNGKRVAAVHRFGRKASANHLKPDAADTSSPTAAPEGGAFQRNASANHFKRNASANHFQRVPSGTQFARNASANHFKRNASANHLERHASKNAGLAQPLVRTASNKTPLARTPTATKLSRTASGVDHVVHNNKVTTDEPPRLARMASLTVISGTRLARTVSTNAGVGGQARPKTPLTRTNSVGASNRLTRTATAGNYARTKSGVPAPKFTRCATATRVRKGAQSPKVGGLRTRSTSRNVSDSGSKASKSDKPTPLQRTNTAVRKRDPTPKLTRTATSTKPFERMPTGTRRRPSGEERPQQQQQAEPQADGAAGMAPPQLVHLTTRRRRTDISTPSTRVGGATPPHRRGVRAPASTSATPVEAAQSATPIGSMSPVSNLERTPTSTTGVPAREGAKRRTAARPGTEFQRHNSSVSPLVRQASKKNF